jgi:hypothetical protein
MMATYTFEPRFCPHCGASAVHLDEHLGYFHFLLRRAFECPCGLHYQNVTIPAMLQAAETSEGDLLPKMLRFYSDKEETDAVA